MTNSEIDLNLFDVGADVDIETLMARIRQHVNGSSSDSMTFAVDATRSVNAVGDALAAQAEFNRELVGALTLLCDQLDAQESDRELRRGEYDHALARVQDQLDERKKEFAHISARLAHAEQERMEALQELKVQVTRWFSALGAFSVRMQESDHQLAELRASIDDQLELVRIRMLRTERALKTNSPVSDAPTAAGAVEPPQAPTPLAKNVRPPQVRETGEALALNGKTLAQPFDYFLFEHEFRGARSDIKQRQWGYVDHFRGRENVLDLGCGRGEFVELLSEEGIPVTGVDLDDDMIDACRERGLRVVASDVFAYLDRLPDASVDGIFAAQLVEHLTPEQVLALVHACEAKLETGGVIILETVNPHCPMAWGNFYLDPTHVRPIPPKLLGFMLAKSSFTVNRFRFSSPDPTSDASPVLELTTDWDARVRFYQDYAVIAVRK